MSQKIIPEPEKMRTRRYYGDAVKTNQTPNVMEKKQHAALLLV